MATQNVTTPTPAPQPTDLASLLALIHRALPKGQEPEFFHYYLGLIEKGVRNISEADFDVEERESVLQAIERARAAAKVYEVPSPIAAYSKCSPDVFGGLYADVIAWLLNETGDRFENWN